ncbi:MAG: UvrD-helicase domain-containing protein [Candidatus Paceibacterota bacterium]
MKQEILNDAQRKAVETTSGPLLIIAGAGAGKTKTLTHRILQIISKGVEPGRVLAITFTNKAAKEMRERVDQLMAVTPAQNFPVHDTSRPFVSTFHRLCIHILRHSAKKVGRTKQFSIFDRDDSIRAMKRAVKAEDMDPKEYDPKLFLNIISREKGDAVTLAEYRARGLSSFREQLVSTLWERYEAILKKENAFDFDDLLLETVVLLKRDEEVKKYFQSAWEYIHVDEYQDTNQVQYELVRLLGEVHQNICVVGDADQTIYGWRGANVKNILNFEIDFPGASTIILEENYRSTQTILTAANEVIEKNIHRKDKKLFTRNGAGEEILISACGDAQHEGMIVSGRAKSLIRDGVKPHEIAVLYRANFQSRALEEAFLRSGVPYQVLGTKFFDRAEVKDIISFIRLARNPDGVSDLERVINVPPRGIGKTTLLKIVAGRESELTSAMKNRLADFRSLLGRIKVASETKKPSELIKFVSDQTGITKHLQDGDEDDNERLMNITELGVVATRFDELPLDRACDEFLESAILASDQDSLDSKQGGVKLMTVHASKGLEFEHVCITGLEDGLFPYRSDGETRRDDLEEERRLFYVALTRAKKRVYLSYAQMRTVFGSTTVSVPSEYFNDIDASLCLYEHKPLEEENSDRVIYLE